MWWGGKDDIADGNKVENIILVVYIILKEIKICYSSKGSYKNLNILKILNPFIIKVEKLSEQVLHLKLKLVIINFILTRIIVTCKLTTTK